MLEADLTKCIRKGCPHLTKVKKNGEFVWLCKPHGYRGIKLIVVDPDKCKSFKEK